MTGQSANRLICVGILVLAVVLLMACRAPDPDPPTDPAALEQGDPAPTAALDSPPVVPTQAQEASTPGVEPTLDSAQFGLPGGLTSNEVTAARLGEAVYSGYSCLIAKEGCACEIPELVRSAFTFLDENTMTFNFSGDGYAAEWEMSHLGPDQWSYTIPMYDEAGAFQGAFFSLLTFTEDGYIYNVGADLDEGGIVTCPDVTFRRMSSGE